MNGAQNSLDYHNPELFAVFISETNEQIEKLVHILLQLEQKPEQQAEYIHEMFRIAHNIKGSSGIVGLDDLKDTMHEVENLFGLVRDGNYYLNEPVIDILLQFTDVLNAYFKDDFGSAGSELASWKTKFQDLVSRQAGASPPVEDAPLILNKQEKLTVAYWQKEEKFVYGVEADFDRQSPWRSPGATAFINHVRRYGRILTIAPPLNQLAEENFTSLKLVLLREKPFSQEEEKEISSFPTEELQTVKIRLWTYREEVVVKEKEKEKPVEPHTIRVESERIDQVINQVGRLLTLKTALYHLHQEGYRGKTTWQQLDKSLQELDQVTGALQDKTMELRMIPVRRLFARFPKIIRDIARQNEKKVELRFSGEDTEIDKQIAEELVDPLTHLLRNSVDHGLEKNNERGKMGKDSTGHILVEARQEGNHIVINVTDDGRGLDLDKIKAKALAAGIISPEQNLSPEDLTGLIFAPGFSTAEQINDISGRGVGLDVVKDKITRLKGDIDVETKFQQGTTFTLKLPLTLAIIQAFMVKVGGQIFGLPVADVAQSIVIKENEIHDVGDRMLYYRYPEVIPLLDLGKRFRFPFKRDPERLSVVIVNHRRRRVGMIVQELLGLEEIMIKSLNKSLGEITDISGASRLGNGQIALILDTAALVQDMPELKRD